MEIRILEKDEASIRFFIRGIDVALANSLRRIMMTEVPVMAIDDVIIIENSSPIKDEILAHRLGFIPLTTNLNSYVLPQECTCESELGCNLCSVTFTLDSEARASAQTIYSKELKSSDPEIGPVSNNIPIMKLARGQNVRLEAYSRLGKGVDHAKWQPTSSSTYKYASAIVVDQKKCTLCKKCVDSCLQRVLTIDDNDKVTILNDEKCTLCSECEKVCPEDAIQVNWLKDAFIFRVESTGALRPENIVTEAINILLKKTDVFSKLIRATIKR